MAWLLEYLFQWQLVSWIADYLGALILLSDYQAEGCVIKRWSLFQQQHLLKTVLWQFEFLFQQQLDSVIAAYIGALIL